MGSFIPLAACWLKLHSMSICVYNCRAELSPAFQNAKKENKNYEMKSISHGSAGPHLLNRNANSFHGSVRDCSVCAPPARTPTTGILLSIVLVVKRPV